VLLMDRPHILHISVPEKQGREIGSRNALSGQRELNGCLAAIV